MTIIKKERIVVAVPSVVPQAHIRVVPFTKTEQLSPEKTFQGVHYVSMFDYPEPLPQLLLEGRNSYTGSIWVCRFHRTRDQFVFDHLPFGHGI